MENKKQQTVLRFIDIDETTFYTTAKIKIRNKNGELIRSLSNQEWNDYPRDCIVEKKEFADFSEFCDAQIFYEKSKPVKSMVKKLQNWSDKMQTDKNFSNDMVVFVTARGDFDNKEKFLDTFRKHHINIDDRTHFYITRTGNLSDDVRMNKILLSTAQRKKIVYLYYIMAKMPAVAELYEDNMKNINDFLELKNEMPSIKYKAYLVENGKIKTIE